MDNLPVKPRLAFFWLTPSKAPNSSFLHSSSFSVVSLEVGARLSLDFVYQPSVVLSIFSVFLLIKPKQDPNSNRLPFAKALKTNNKKLSQDKEYRSVSFQALLPTQKSI